MESKTMKTRISAVAVALVMLLSIFPIVAMAEEYGMQGDNTDKNVKLQMVDPSNITVNSATTGNYDNTINTPVNINNGVAVFKFKTSVAGGQYGNVANGVQNTTFTDENGQAVSGVGASAQDIDSSSP